MSAQVVVLGSGTSNGVPMPGAEYSSEFLAHPHNWRTRSSIVVQGPGGNLLVDCAPELRLQVVREGIRRVDAVIVTHTHADHVMGMDDLRSFCLRQGSEIPIFTLPRYAADIRRVFGYAFVPPPPGTFVPRFDLRELSLTGSGETFDLVGLPVRLFPVEHGNVPVIALRIGGFGYLTDVSRIPPEAEAQLHGLEILMIDAVRLAPHPSHLNLDGALEIIARLDPKVAYLTHLSGDFDAGAPPTLPPNVRLAYDGLRLDLTAFWRECAEKPHK